MKSRYSIYLMHPISLSNTDDIHNWYDKTIENLEDFYIINSPIHDTNLLRTQQQYRAEYYGDPSISNSAIVSRDLLYASKSDILFVDFTGSTIASIGCCFELAVGYWLHKHIVAVLPNDNIHNHSFVKQACSVIYDDYNEAIDYLRSIS